MLCWETGCWICCHRKISEIGLPAMYIAPKSAMTKMQIIALFLTAAISVNGISNDGGLLWSLMQRRRGRYGCRWRVTWMKIDLTWRGNFGFKILVLYLIPDAIKELAFGGFLVSITATFLESFCSFLHATWGGPRVRHLANSLYTWRSLVDHCLALVVCWSFMEEDPKWQCKLLISSPKDQCGISISHILLCISKFAISPDFLDESICKIFPTILVKHTSHGHLVRTIYSILKFE